MRAETQPGWKARAAAKVASTLSKIPPEWRLSDEELSKAAKQRDITGAFIEQYLDSSELMIIKEEAVTIVEKLKEGTWTAKQVTLAFCKTAAISHQIVSREAHSICFIH
jgi:amidase